MRFEGAFHLILIHLDSGFKFDLFVAGRHPLGRDQILHRKKVSTALFGGDPANPLRSGRSEWCGGGWLPVWRGPGVPDLNERWFSWV
jgi:hypothetical protein